MANKTEHIYTGLLSLFYNYYFNVLFLSFKGQKVDTDFFVLVLMAFILCASFTGMQCRIFLRGKTDNCMGGDGGKSGGGGLDRDAADADAASWRDADAGPKDQSTARCIARVQQAARVGRLLFVRKLRRGWRCKHQ